MHLTQNEVGDYCRRRLCPEALLRVADHIAECESCRQRIENEVNPDEAFVALRSEIFDEFPLRVHTTAEEAAGYVDETLAGEDLQIVADHLASCERCAAAVDDLNAFRSSITSLDRELGPAQGRGPIKRWWARVSSPLTGLVPRSQALAFGSAFGVLLLAVVGWLVSPGKPGAEREEAYNPLVVARPVPQSSRLIAQVYDGDSLLTLDETGRLSGADKLPIAYQVMLKRALISQRVGASKRLSRLTRTYSPLMSTEKQRGDFGLIMPVGRVLLTDRPTFGWSPLQGATGYVVEVYDSAFNLVAASPELKERSWAAPSLLRGTDYTWQVKAIKDGQEFRSPLPPSPQAGFRIVNRAKANELLNARRRYSSSHLALGLLYAEAGLLEEAEQELRALETANPDSEIIRRLLNQIQAMRRR